MGADGLLVSFLALVSVLATAVGKYCLLPGGAVLGGCFVELPVLLPLRDVKATQQIWSLYKPQWERTNDKSVLIRRKYLVLPPWCLTTGAAVCVCILYRRLRSCTNNARCD